MTDKEERDNVGFAGIGKRIFDLKKNHRRTGPKSKENNRLNDKRGVKADTPKKERDLDAIRAREKARAEEREKAKAEGKTETESEKDSDWGSRKLCSDENCIGVIGPNGYCTECGKLPVIEENIHEGHKIIECPKCEIKLRLPSVSKSLKVRCPNCDHTFLWNIKEGIVSEKSSTSPAGRKNKRIKKAILWVALIVCFVGALIYFANDSQRNSLERAKQKPEPKTDSFTFQKSSKTYPESIKKNRFNLTRESFSELYNAPVLVKEIQICLYILGYPVGNVDGIIGSKTYAAFMQFVEDFQVLPRNSVAKELLSSLTRCSKIAETHADFRKLVVSGELDSWIDNQPYDSKQIYRRIRDSGEPRKVILVIDRLKFFKENPRPLGYPSTACIDRDFFEGVAPFKIKTTYSGYHYYIKLVERLNRQEILTAFIRSGETLSTKVPPGSYYLKYASGENWYGKKYLFGPNTMYSQADKILDFYPSGQYVHGYTIELYLQPDGNLPTKEISAFDF